MGLDMYLTGRKFFWQNLHNRGNDRHEDDKRVTTLDVELAYWRKHPDLHGYMVMQFGKGKDDCKEIELSADDLRQTIAAVKAKELPKTSGFFFGESDGSERDDDIKALTEALGWLESGDESPVDILPVIKSQSLSGIAMVQLKPRTDDKESKPRQITRSVHYRGDW